MKQAAFISNLDGTRSPTSAKLAVTMLMPYLNESDTLADAFKRHRRASSGLKLPGEVLIADNRLGGRVVRVREKGCGNALRTGIEGAQGTWIVMGDD
jgi:hypothetical protein